MSVWLFWIAAVLASSLVYNVVMRVTAKSMPMWSYMLVGGLVMLSMAAVGYSRDESANVMGFSPLQYGGIIILGLSLAVLEVSMFKMYSSGAPVALARALITTTSMALLLGIGVVVFKEHITTQQMAGIALAMCSVALIVWKV